MPPAAGAADLPETGLSELRHEPHEPVARRIGIDRIGLDHPGALGAGVGDRGLEGLAAEALTAHRPLEEEAGERPDALLHLPFLLEPAERPVGRARRDRAPGDRLVALIADDADWNARFHPFVHGRLALGILHVTRLGSARPPGHAPAIFGRPRAFEQSGEIVPARLFDLVEGELRRRLAGPTSRHAGPACH